jgi:hypothetical protein
MAAPCNRCEVPAPAWDALNSDNATCAFCGARSLVRVFPALFWRPADAAPAPVAGEGEAACFDHPSKRAVAHCSQCGRFVCQLCAIDFRSGVWCPECFAAGRSRQKTAELEQGRLMYDSIALAIALGPLLVWPLTLLTAPAAIYVAVRYWRRPQSLVRWRRWRSVLAILIATAQIVGWVWLGGYVYYVMKAAK